MAVRQGDEAIGARVVTHTIRRTPHSRRVELLLRAEEVDAGPYYLVDRMGYGVAWTKPRKVFVGDRPRQESWVPTFQRARLAFELCLLDESLSAKDAKRAADRTAKRIDPAQPNAVWHALELVGGIR